MPREEYEKPRLDATIQSSRACQHFIEGLTQKPGKKSFG